MTFTQDDLIPLKQALLSGATSVSMDGRTVNFQSIAELTKLITSIEASIAAQESPEATPVNPRKITATFSK